MGKDSQKFLDIDSSFDNSKFIIIPAEIGGTSCGRKGAEKAPERIIRASWQIEDIDTELKINFTHCGIHATEKVHSLEELEEKIRYIVSRGKIPITIGGEHFITHRILKGISSFYGKVSAVFFDAHADMFSEFEGNKLSHACALYLSIPYLEDFLCIGVRNISPKELDEIKKLGVEDKFIFFEDFFDKNPYIPSLEILEEKVEDLNKKSDLLYLSFDYDFLDPSSLPHLSTPEPPGFSFREATYIIKSIISNFKGKICGADFVEMCPDEDEKSFHSEVTSAKIISKTISYIYYFKLRLN
jgi:agmatinase